MPLPFGCRLVTTRDPSRAFPIDRPLGVTTSMWIGPDASGVRNLVVRRMHATTSAAYLLVVTFIDLAVGPSTPGRLRVATDDLGLAILLARWWREAAL